MIKNQMILNHIDFTLLKAFASWTEVEVLCKKAIEKKTASVCIPSSYVKRVHETFGSQLNICTVIGFPLGYIPTSCKVFEAKQAVEDGASEVDMVINITDVKNNRFDLVQEEISLIKTAIGNNILKVIIETCYLTQEEKIKLCKAVTAAKADYIKTSTGFGSAGATFEDIKLFKEHIGPDVKIKAAGGIRTASDMVSYIDLGCERIGASSIECLE